MIKTVELVKKKQGITLDEFSRYWKEIWAPLFLRAVPGVRRYVQNVSLKLSDKEPAYDGIAEVWWDDLQTFQESGQHLQSEAGDELPTILNAFLELRQLVIVFVEERVIK